MTIYEIDGDGTSPLEESPYEQEAELQDLIARNPGILAGDNPSDNERWLLVDTEVGLGDADGAADRWYVDNLYLNQDGLLTLVEVKMASNPEIRRKIVGQMLDYAANAVVHWKLDRLRDTFDARCRNQGLEPDEHLTDALGLTISAEAFWSGVKTNLSAGHLRLLFVADSIPPELQRIVEFLNEQMEQTEVLALEVRRLGRPDDPARLLSVRTIGQTIEAHEVKTGGHHASRGSRGWSAASVLEDLGGRKGQQAELAGRALYEWGKGQSPKVEIGYGSGQKDGSIKFFLRQGDQRTALFYIYSNGRVEIPFAYLTQHPSFESVEEREALRLRITERSPIKIGRDQLDRHPSFEIALLKDAETVQDFIESVAWFVSRLESEGSTDPAA